MAKKKRGAPQKSCPKCNTVVHARTGTCPKCSHAFVAKTKTVKKKAATKTPLIARTATKKISVKKAVVKRTATKKRKAKRRGRPPGAAAASGGGGFSVSDIQAAKSLAGRVGGSAKAKQLLDALG